MSSLYYANALFSKYPAASSVFATGAFPEQTSCAFASNPQRPGYGAGSGASFAASMQGLYPGGGGMAGQSAAGVYAAGYGLEPSSFNMHCAPFEQSLSGVCPGDSAKAAGAKEQRDSDVAAESNFRIYPWMRSSGNAAHRAVPSGPEPQWPGHIPRKAPPSRPSAPLLVQSAPGRRSALGTRPPTPSCDPARRPHSRFCLVLSGSLAASLADPSPPTPRRSEPPAHSPHPSSRPFSFKYLSAAPARAGEEAVCLAEEDWGLQRIAIRISPLPSPFPSRGSQLWVCPPAPAWIRSRGGGCSAEQFSPPSFFPANPAPPLFPSGQLEVGSRGLVGGGGVRGDEDSARDTEPERQVEREGLRPRESRLLTPSKLGKREAGELEKLEKGAEASGEYSWLPQVPFLAPLENWPTSLQVSFQKGDVLLGETLGLQKAKSRESAGHRGSCCRNPKRPGAPWGLLTSLSQTTFIMLSWTQRPISRSRRPKTCGRKLPIQPGLRARRAQLLHFQYSWSCSPLPAS